MTPAPTLPPFDVLPFVEAYETARQAGGHATVRAHLPPRNHRCYLVVLTELVRVDLEYEWAAGRRRSLADCLREYPELAERPESVAEVAFEEYRQRQESGEDPQPTEYGQRYGIDASGWAAEPTTAGEPLLFLKPAAEEIVDAARTFRLGLGGDRPPDVIEPAATLPTTPALELFHALNQSAPAVAERLADAVASFPTAGSDFLGFRLVRELGRGSFARVFLAEQANLAGRPVVVKVTTNLTGEPQTLAQLQHTNIVPIYSVHTHGSLQAQCMPYFGSLTLADVIADRHAQGDCPRTGALLGSTLNNRRASTRAGSTVDRPGDRPAPGTAPPAPPAEPVRNPLAGLTHADAMLWITARLADGLAHAHDRGIQHRDLKPANVLLTDDGQPMLLDFNLAEDANLAPGAACGGTLAYMSPEHLELYAGELRRLDARSDVYSLGVILFELLTGRQAFPRASGSLKKLIPEMIRQRYAVDGLLREPTADFSPAVAAIVRKCLDPDRTRRYQRAADLRDDLDRHLANLPLRHAANTSVAERARKWARRNPHLTSTSAVAAAAVCAVAVAAVTLVSWRDNLRSLTARQSFRDAQHDLADARAALYRRDPTPVELDAGLARARACLDRYGVLTRPDWESQPTVRYLPDPDRDRLREDMSESLYLLAKGTIDLARRQADGRTERLANARAWNEGAVALGGQLPRALALQKADLVEQTGQAAAATDLRKSAERTRAGGPRDLYLLGHEYARRGEYERAIPVLAEATRLDPTSFSAWFVRGLCHHSRMQFDRAAECFSACLALQPDDARAWQNRGLAAFVRQRHADALADLNRAVELLPDEPDLRIDRALVRTALGQHPDAVADLTAALDLGSTRTRVYFMRAIVRKRAGDAAGAEADRALGRTRTPTDEGSWLARAEDRSRRDPTGALADVDEALELNPISATALQFRASLLTDLGRTAEAGAALDKAVDLYPDHAPFWCGRAVHRARLGQRDAALSDAREALRRDTTPPNLYQAGCAFALTSATHPDDALEAFRLLRAAVAAGFGGDLLAIDTDLDAIRQQPEFAAIGKLARAAKRTLSGP